MSTIVSLWAKATRQLSLSGTVMTDTGGGVFEPLRGVRVDIYRFSTGVDGTPAFAQLQLLPARTSNTGDFTFAGVPVPVEVQEVIPGTPPYTPVEIVNPASLPNIVFRITVEAEVLQGGLAAGNEFVEVYDERAEVDPAWIGTHPDRLGVQLSGESFTILIPEGNAVAAAVAGNPGTSVSTVPGKQVHLLRVGRVTRDEITEFGPASAGRVGYMNSAPASFFPGVVDAPFGGALQIGGHFGVDFLTPPLSDNLYYTVSVSQYSGAHTNPFNPANLAGSAPLVDSLFNKKYILPTPAQPNGVWQSLHLGPFTGTITAVEAPHSPTLVGAGVQVYKRPPLPDLATEYWPFWDLLAIWNSAAAPNGLAVLTIEVYEKVGGTDQAPQLKKRAVTSSVNEHLPLHIDNRPPVPVFRPFDPAFPARPFCTDKARFLGVAHSFAGPRAVMGLCNEMGVLPGDADGNECILLKYSVEDGSGAPHDHVLSCGLWAEYTPKAVPGAADARAISLLPAFAGADASGGFQNISHAYPAGAASPVWQIDNFRSVVAPAAADGWPPEPAGDLPPGSAVPDPAYQCPIYAVEIGLYATVRTIDGWSRLYGTATKSRHLIVKRS